MRVEARAAGDRPAVATALGASIKSAYGVTVSVELVEPGAIERSTGKAQRVVDLR